VKTTSTESREHRVFGTFSILVFSSSSTKFDYAPGAAQKIISANASLCCHIQRTTHLIPSNFNLEPPSIPSSVTRIAAVRHAAAGEKPDLPRRLSLTPSARATWTCHHAGRQADESQRLGSVPPIASTCARFRSPGHAFAPRGRHVVDRARPFAISPAAGATAADGLGTLLAAQ